MMVMMVMMVLMVDGDDNDDNDDDDDDEDDDVYTLRIGNMSNTDINLFRLVLLMNKVKEGMNYIYKYVVIHLC